MKTSHRSHRGISLRIALSAGVTVLGLSAALASGVAYANDRGDADASCRQETKRVAVWPKGPKAARVARFEEREVTVCDGKVVSQPPSDAERHANSSGD